MKVDELGKKQEPKSSNYNRDDHNHNRKINCNSMASSMNVSGAANPACDSSKRTNPQPVVSIMYLRRLRIIKVEHYISDIF